MIHAVSALVGLALTAAAPAQATETAQPPTSPRSAAVGTENAGGAERPEDVSRVADWIATSKDNGTLPYIIIDKKEASLFLFDARGRARGMAPVLIGIAVGDDATPGVGGKSLAQIGPAERTTPAGRFVARYGLAAGHERVLWVDYATSVALHPVVKGTKQERRAQRLASPTSEDNRISFGCINVPIPFYNRRVQPLFGKKGGVVYILPDTKTLEEVFPRLLVQPYLTAAVPDDAATSAEAAPKPKAAKASAPKARKPASARSAAPKARRTPPSPQQRRRGSRTPQRDH